MLILGAIPRGIAPFFCPLLTTSSSHGNLATHTYCLHHTPLPLLLAPHTIATAPHTIAAPVSSTPQTGIQRTQTHKKIPAKPKFSGESM